ncbi:M48 family metallopeptidase [Lachnospiraceae bacterium OttesenSCG-928-D06]|nr:M48 family metallopeptidase [Lachnospiraceae bacterium OttesenSCG-928-D06]
MKIEIRKSNRKTISLEVNKNAEVIVRAPYYATDKQIEEWVQEKSSWIEKSIEKAKKRKELIGEQDLLTIEELNKLAEQALSVIPKKVAYYAEKIGVSYSRITIRNQRSKWGSCSGKGNLNFNCLLMLAPSEVLDYVIVHELCHRKEMNHSPLFWKEVENVLPDYKVSRLWLKEHGQAIMARMIGDA